MKKFYIFLMFTNLFLVSCSKDDAIYTEPETPNEEIPAQKPEMNFLPSETFSYMVDPSATKETIALFYNLKAISYSNFVVGQHDALSSFYTDNQGFSDMKKLTGSDPGMLGSDFMFITDDQNNEKPGNFFYQQEQLIKTKAVEAYDKGMINIFCWHLREPSNFYANNLYKVLTDNEVKLGFMMFWQNYSDAYTVPVPGVEGAEDFIEFEEKEESLLLKDLPKMYELPQDNNV